MQEQQEIQVLEQMQLASRRPIFRETRGRVAAGAGVAGGAPPVPPTDNAIIFPLPFMLGAS